ncbi:MAG: putative lipid flippase MurJ [Pedosphaera sp.]|nr:putative lipid flippase MurJ [Pedosphaera sp.]
MLKSSGAMAAATMMSRVLGMVREIVYSWFMGVGMVAGAFQLAFQIPNLFRRLLGEGALTASFIPIFKEKERTTSPQEMWRAANAVISGLLVSATLIIVLAVAAISIVLAVGPYGKPRAATLSGDDLRNLRSFSVKLKEHTGPVSKFLWEGFSDATRQEIVTYAGTSAESTTLKATLVEELNRMIQGGAMYEQTRFAGVKLSPDTRKLAGQTLDGGQTAALNRLLLEDAFPREISDHQKETELMLRLLRVMFPYMLLICVTAVFMGMLNARGHFFIPASGALIMNVVMIASVFLLAPHMGVTKQEQIFALAIGVLVAGVAQAAFQLPTLRREGFRYYWVSPWRDETVRRVVRQMIPGTIGVAAFQINVLMTQGVAFWVDPSIVAQFNVAVRLMELPQGVFGVSLATFLLPTLSGLAAEKKYGEFRSTLNQGLDHLVFINLLASMLLFVLAGPIIRLLFEHGAFTAEDTPKVVAALVWLAPGLLAFSMVNILARAFYALGDTKTPMKISIFCLGLNLTFALMLVWKLRQGGLGMANTISAAFNVFLLFYALRRKLGSLELETLERIIFQMLGAVAVAGLVAWGLSHWWEQAIGGAGLWRRLGAVFVPMTVASIIYWGMTLWFKVPPALEIGALVLQKAGLGRKLKIQV